MWCRTHAHADLSAHSVVKIHNLQSPVTGNPCLFKDNFFFHFNQRTAISLVPFSEYCKRSFQNLGNLEHTFTPVLTKAASFQVPCPAPLPTLLRVLKVTCCLALWSLTQQGLGQRQRQHGSPLHSTPPSSLVFGVRVSLGLWSL